MFINESRQICHVAQARYAVDTPAIPLYSIYTSISLTFNLSR